MSAFSVTPNFNYNDLCLRSASHPRLLLSNRAKIT